jgi:hypothetical protein
MQFFKINLSEIQRVKQMQLVDLAIFRDSLKGFRILAFGWSDGASFLPLDFVLCSSADVSKRLQGIRKEIVAD